MSKSTFQYPESQKEINSHRFKFFLNLFAFLAIIILGCASLYFVVIPAVFERLSCIDFLSGHVPKKAEEIFLDRLFEAMINKDYDWLSKVSTEEAFRQLKEIQPIVTKNFTIIGGDDLTGVYERRIQFDNRKVVYLVYHGSWACPAPDFTEQEVFQRIQLIGITKE